MKHYQLRITGKVQGVFFRQSSKEKADELGITGFARNEPDGSVYIEAEGPEQKLEQLLNWCKKGPEMARVKEVECVPGQLKGYRGFEVRR